MNAIQARNRLKEIWSQLRHIWPWDRQYVELTPEMLQAMSDKIRHAKIVFADDEEIVFGDLYNLGDFWDCDDFACGAEFLMKLLHKIHSEKEGSERLPIAYGQARGSQFRGRPGLHALNIALTTDGVWFNDHDDGGRTWKADSENDSIFYASL